MEGNPSNSNGPVADEMDVSSNCGQEDMDDIEARDSYKTDDTPCASRENKSTRNCVLKMLDEMERRVLQRLIVEKLRADTLKIEAERDDILTSLDTLSNSQLVHNLDGIDLDEVSRYIKRLIQRSAAVRSEISTERSMSQQESLYLVNTLIDSLIREVKSDATLARKRCMSYMNSCLDSSDAMYHENCAVDATFEEAVLGCTLEDQKRIKKRLSGLFSYFSTYSPSLTEITEEDETSENAGPSRIS